MALAAPATLLAAAHAHAQGIHHPDAQYRSFADSPFAAVAFSAFFLENFEDGLLNTPGAAAIGGVALRRADDFYDSVDGDDGVIDNNGNTGGSTTGAYYSAGLSTLRSSFTPLPGGLPTHAGLVVTDTLADSDITLRAFRGGPLLGQVSGHHIHEHLHFCAQDRFYGFVDAGGIDAIEISAATDSDWAMDHLQYGRSCPSDFNGDGFLDFFDYDDYVQCFETGACPPGTTADFNQDGFADFFDDDDFVAAFQAGC
jgi:hypothetical protein